MFFFYLDSALPENLIPSHWVGFWLESGPVPLPLGSISTAPSCLRASPGSFPEQRLVIKPTLPLTLLIFLAFDLPIPMDFQWHSFKGWGG